MMYLSLEGLQPLHKLFRVSELLCISIGGEPNEHN